MKKQDAMQFTLEQVQEAALYSVLSYYQKDSQNYKDIIAEIDKHGGISKVKKVVPFYKFNDNNSDNLAGMVIATDDKMIIAYHGTDNLDEFTNDLKVYQSPMILPNGSKIFLHSGFMQEFYLSNNDRERAMNEAQVDNKYKKICYTGHSLGGALAICAAMYDANGKIAKNIEQVIITLGSPRILSPAAAKLYEKSGLLHKTLNIRQKADPVPMLPATMMNYRHVGHIVEVPTELSSRIHITEAYDTIVKGKYSAQTHEALKKLENAPTIESCRAFSADDYKNLCMKMTPMMFGAMMRRHRGISSTIASVALTGLRNITPASLEKVNSSNFITSPPRSKLMPLNKGRKF